MLQRDNSPPAFAFGKQYRGTNSRRDRDLANVGPFSYDKSFVDKKKESAYSMGAKLGSSMVDKNSFAPAPNNYNPMTT